MDRSRFLAVAERLGADLSGEAVLTPDADAVFLRIKTGRVEILSVDAKRGAAAVAFLCRVADLSGTPLRFEKGSASRAVLKAAGATSDGWRAPEPVPLFVLLRPGLDPDRTLGMIRKASLEGDLLIIHDETTAKAPAWFFGDVFSLGEAAREEGRRVLEVSIGKPHGLRHIPLTAETPFAAARLGLPLLAFGRDLGPLVPVQENEEHHALIAALL